MREDPLVLEQPDLGVQSLAFGASSQPDTHPQMEAKILLLQVVL